MEFVQYKCNIIIINIFKAVIWEHFPLTSYLTIHVPDVPATDDGCSDTRNMFCKTRTVLIISLLLVSRNFGNIIAILFPGMGLILTPQYVIGIHNFPIPSGLAGELFCRIVVSYYLLFTLGIVSVYTITCLSLERWFAVAKPAKYRAGFKSFFLIFLIF